MDFISSWFSNHTTWDKISRFMGSSLQVNKSEGPQVSKSTGQHKLLDLSFYRKNISLAIINLCICDVPS